MPLYEYKCSRCEKVHEVMQKFSDAPLEICPDCQGSVTKMVSLGSFALKGTGWYTTDYKRASSPSSGAGDSASATPASPTTPGVAAPAAQSPTTETVAAAKPAETAKESKGSAASPSPSS